jgi:uncharacterized membrane protein YfcA
VTIAALLGGVTNGLIGAWGPVVTPYLLNRAVRPRIAIGSVNTAEVAVASTSAFTLIGSLGVAGVDGRVLLAMLAGGVVAAPLAAWLVRHVPPRVLGTAVGGVIVLTNARTLLRSDWIDAPAGPRWAVYAVVYLVWAAALAYSIRAHRAAQRSERLAATAS